MKTVRMKILFVIFLFSSTVPSVMQAMGSEILKAGSYIVQWVGRNPESLVGLVGAGFAILYLESKLLDKWDYYKLEKKVNNRIEELLSKAYSQELVNGDSLGYKAELSGDLSKKRYLLTFLDEKLLKEARDALKFLEVPDSSIKKLLILGVKCADSLQQEIYPTGTTLTILDKESLRRIPYAMLVGIQSSSASITFNIIHEGAHVKTCCEGTDAVDEELNEVIADTYALDAFISKKEDLKNLVSGHSDIKPHPYLSFQELVYHGEKVFDIQQRGDKLDPLTYAQKIVVDRKENDYEKKIKTGAKKIIGDLASFVNANRLSNSGLTHHKDGTEETVDS